MSARLFKRLRGGPKLGLASRAAPMAKPACFATQADFDAWLLESRRFAASTAVNPKNYCVDCLPAFQCVMKAQGRCGHPDVEFVKYDGGVYGRRPQLPRTKG